MREKWLRLSQKLGVFALEKQPRWKLCRIQGLSVSHTDQRSHCLVQDTLSFLWNNLSHHKKYFQSCKTDLFYVSVKYGIFAQKPNILLL